MKVPYLSASRLKMAESCPAQYQMHYDPDSTPHPERCRTLKKLSNHPDNTQAAMLGSAVHLALEIWRTPDPKTGKTPKPRLPALLKAYTKGLEEFPGISFDFAEAGEDMIRRWFDRRGREPIKVIGCEHSIGEQNPDKRWDITPHIFESGVPCFGFIDLVLEHRDGTIELVDYKTQWMPIHQDEADSSVQAGIYLLYAREKWPGRPLKFSFDLTRYGVVSSVWSDEKLDSFSRWLKSRYQMMVDLEDPQAKIGSACKWCAYSELCPEATALTKKGEWERVAKGAWSTHDEMFDELATIKAAKAILDRSQKAIEATIKNDIFSPNDLPEDCKLDTGKWEVEWKETERIEYLPSEIRPLVAPAVFEQMVTTSKTKVERALKILPEDVADAIKRSRIIKPSRRLSLRIRGDGFDQ